MDRCAGVRLVLTSREALGTNEERVRRVLPLSGDDEVDGTPGPAVELFCQRASAVDDSFTPGPDVFEDITAICERLDGLPLAIELAASRIRSMAPAEIRLRFDDRFRLLTGTSHRGSIERHQTLRATVEWSHSQLSPTDAAVFARLGVFTGGFTTDAALAVAAGSNLESWDVIDALDSLVAKSLLDTETSHDLRRFRMLETLRLFALEQLADAEEVETTRDAHLGCYTNLCERTDDELYGPDGIEWQAAGVREIDNLRTAFEWALERDDIDAAQHIAGSEFLLVLAPVAEVAQDWAPRSVASGHIGHSTADACANAVWGALSQADVARAFSYYESGRNAISKGARDRGSLARARVAAGIFAQRIHRDALAIIDKEIASAARADDLARLAHAHCYRSIWLQPTSGGNSEAESDTRRRHREPQPHGRTCYPARQSPLARLRRMARSA